jgi:predicted nucleic acid-binding protein
VGETWVVNASPIISLGWIGRLDLLEADATRLLLPEAVVMEVCAGPPLDHARLAVERGWGPNRIAVRPTTDVIEWGLGAGESAVIALARQERATAILDDAEARSCARTFGVPVMGTLGVILRAKVTGRIASAGAVVTALRAAGFWLDPKVARDALRRAVGEDWEG